MIDFTSDLESQRSAAADDLASATAANVAATAAFRAGTGTQEARRETEQAVHDAQRIVDLFDFAIRQQSRGGGTLGGPEGSIASLLVAATAAYELRDLITSVGADFQALMTKRDQTYTLAVSCDSPFRDGSVEPRQHSELDPVRIGRMWRTFNTGAAFGQNLVMVRPIDDVAPAYVAEHRSYVARVLDTLAELESRVA